MKLENNEELFLTIAIQTSDRYSRDKDEVIKEYFITKYLSDLFNYSKDYVLKGSAAVKLCYNLLNRSYNDVDLTSVDENKEKSVFEKLNDEHNMPIKWIETGDYRHQQGLYKTKVKDTEIAFNIDFVNHDYYDQYDNKYLICDIQRYLIETEQVDIIEAYNLKPVKIKTRTITDIFVSKIFAGSNKYISKSHREQESMKHLKDALFIYQNYSFDTNELIERIEFKRNKDASFFPSERAKEIFKFEVLNNIFNERFNGLIDDELRTEMDAFAKKIFVDCI